MKKNMLRVHLLLLFLKDIKTFYKHLKSFYRTYKKFFKQNFIDWYSLEKLKLCLDQKLKQIFNVKFVWVKKSLIKKISTY